MTWRPNYEKKNILVQVHNTFPERHLKDMNTNTADPQSRPTPQNSSKQGLINKISKNTSDKKRKWLLFQSFVVIDLNKH
eukprot:264800-Amphidinium_carterae.1